MKTRIVLTIMFIVCWTIFGVLYQNISGPYEAEQALAQVNGDSVEYVVGRAQATGMIEAVVNIAFGVALLLTWISPALKAGKNYLKENQND